MTRRTLTLIPILALLVSIALPSIAGAEDLPPVAARPPQVEGTAPYEPLDERLTEIHRRVQNAARYPREASERSESGETWVAFMITPEGLPLGVTTSRSSGHPALDRAAELSLPGNSPCWSKREQGTFGRADDHETGWMDDGRGPDVTGRRFVPMQPPEQVDGIRTIRDDVDPSVWA